VQIKKDNDSYADKCTLCLNDDAQLQLNIMSPDIYGCMLVTPLSFTKQLWNVMLAYTHIHMC